MEKIIINKLGGEIMGTPELNAMAVSQLQKQIQEKYNVIVVVSALKDITDTLIDATNKIVQDPHRFDIQNFCDHLLSLHIHHAEGIYKEKSNIEKLQDAFQEEFEGLKNSFEFIRNFGYVDFVADKIIAYGEKLSSHIIKFYFEENNIPTKRLSAEEIGITTDRNYGDANIDYAECEKQVPSKLSFHDTPVLLIPGFTGIDPFGRTTTLGRGGTDTSACLLGALLKAEKVILWKSINGVLTSDPRIVHNTKTIDYLDYDEAEESGKVVCSKAITYLKIHNTPMEVAYIRDSAQKTIVGVKKDYNKNIKLISSIKDCSLLKIHSPEMTQSGFLYKVSSIFNDYSVNMNFIRNSRDTLYIAIENKQKNVHPLLEALKKISLLHVDKCSMINIIGNLDWEMATRINNHLAKISKNPQIGVFPQQECSRLEILVNQEEMETILCHFHDTFILGK